MARLPLVTHAERDAEDARLLAQGEFATLLATYYPVMLDRVLAKRFDRARADEVVHDACLRLLSELRRGRTYSVPFRVVVHNVLGWTLKGMTAPPESLLPEDWDVPVDDPGLDLALEHIDMDGLFALLSPREREIVILRYREELEISQIADRLGMTRNAVDQALWRAHRKLRELMLDA